MKKKIFLLVILGTILFPIFAQKGGTDISAAINDAANEIAKKISSSRVIAVTKFSADTKELSDWLENEMFRSLSKKALKLVERNAKNMNILNSELDYQYSGVVSDATITAFGEQLGADYIVYGSFEQFGGIKNFDFRLTNVETFEVVAAKSYEIARSEVLTELLGTDMQLSSISDYISVVNSLDTKLNLVQKEMTADRDRAENAIRMEYQNKINDKTKEITELYDGMYSGSKLRAEIDNAIKPIESERDVLLKPVAENSRAKFADQISKIENNKASLLRELEKSNFTVEDGSISVELLRKMENESAYFALSLRSTDRYVNYSLSDRIDPATPADFKKIRDAAETTKSVRGEIEYSLKQKASDSTTFDIVVTSVRVFDSVTGDTLYKKSGRDLDNKNGGTISMVAQKSGTAERTTKAPATTTAPAKKADPAPATTAKANSSSSTSTTKTDISSSQKKVTGSSTGTSSTKSATPAKSSNPFERGDFWVLNNSKASGTFYSYVDVKDNQLLFRGNTGKSVEKDGRWLEAACWGRQEMMNFLQKGKGLNFKVKGDGHTYYITFVFKDNDDTRYTYTFKTKKDVVTNVSFLYSNLKHAPWTEKLPFDIKKVDSVTINYDFGENKNDNEAFSIAMYNFEVIK